MDPNNEWSDDGEEVPSSILPTESLLDEAMPMIEELAVTIRPMVREKGSPQQNSLVMGSTLHPRQAGSSIRGLGSSCAWGPSITPPRSAFVHIGLRPDPPILLPRVRPVPVRPSLLSIPRPLSTTMSLPLSARPALALPTPIKYASHQGLPPGSRLALISIPSDSNTSVEGAPTPSLTQTPQTTTRTNWRLHEIITLVEDKKEVQARQSEGGVYERTRRNRWQMVAETSQARGVMRNKAQCKTKWEKLHSLFDRLNDYERKIPSGWSSYWQMTQTDRCTKGLPVEDFTFKLYNKMQMLFGGDRNADIRGLLVDSMKDDTTPLGDKEDNHTMPGDGDTTGKQKTPPLATNNGGGPSDASVEGSSGGIKRKRRSRVNGNNIKELMDSMKNLAMVLQSSKD
ncbi:hypothetical protein GOP47_0003577 [Adiantum capillus-veneris]|uniref:Myb-like domain-containing protein n=1 Tax=Adiantum capillus-veneris TaxID=13818 RepID=A0A9D4ZM04_ADICA|nr:hypothetical protein GOP47_0003577 [Adiantum capillus-veneris]